MNAAKVAVYVRRQIVKIWLGRLVALGLLLATSYLLLQHYWRLCQNTALWWGGLWSGALIGIILLIFTAWLKQEAKKTREASPQLLDRVEGITKELCAIRGHPMPQIAILTKLGDEKKGKLLRFLGAMLDRFGRIDLVILGNALVEKSTDQQLRGILAHELRHSNQAENMGRLVHMFLRVSLGGAFTFGVWTYGYHAWSEYGFEGAAIAVLAAHALKALHNRVQGYVEAYVSRATESKTDALAAADLGAPNQLIEALERLEAELDITPIPRQTPRMMRSHPTTKQRRQALEALVA